MKIKSWDGEGFTVKGRADGTVRVIFETDDGEIELEFAQGPARDLADSLHAAAGWAKDQAG